MTFVDFLDMVLDGNGSVIFSATWTSDGNGGGSGYTEMHENEEDAIDAHVNYSMNNYGRTVLPMNTRAAYNYYTRNSNNVFAYRSDGLRFSRFGTASEKWFIKKFTYFELRNNPFNQEIGDAANSGGQPAAVDLNWSNDAIIAGIIEHMRYYKNSDVYPYHLLDVIKPGIRLSGNKLKDSWNEIYYAFGQRTNDGWGTYAGGKVQWFIQPSYNYNANFFEGGVNVEQVFIQGTLDIDHWQIKFYYECPHSPGITLNFYNYESYKKAKNYIGY